MSAKVVERTKVEKYVNDPEYHVLKVALASGSEYKQSFKSGRGY